MTKPVNLIRTITDQAVKCLLKDPRATSPTLIYLVFRYQYTRFKTSTRQSILPDLWDSENGRALTHTKNRALLSFTAYIVRFVQESKAGKRLTAKEKKSAAYTLAGYIKLKRVLERYQTETGNPIEYDSYSMPYYDAFKLWLTNRGLALNYVGTLLKDLKLMLKQSHLDGLHENTVYQNPKFKKFSGGSG